MAKLEGIIEEHNRTKTELNEEINKYREREIEYKNKMVMYSYHANSYNDELNRLREEMKNYSGNNSMSMSTRVTNKFEDDEDVNWGSIYSHGFNEKDEEGLGLGVRKEEAEFKVKAPIGLEKIPTKENINNLMNDLNIKIKNNNNNSSKSLNQQFMESKNNPMVGLMRSEIEDLKKKLMESSKEIQFLTASNANIMEELNVRSSEIENLQNLNVSLKKEVDMSKIGFPINFSQQNCEHILAELTKT